MKCNIINGFHLLEGAFILEKQYIRVKYLIVVMNIANNIESIIVTYFYTIISLFYYYYFPPSQGELCNI